jgi:hypothetical protein
MSFLTLSYKTDKSKRYLFSFGGKLLTDKKSPPLFLRSIFNPSHHSLPFLVLFLAVGMDLVGKRCGGILGLSVIVLDLQANLKETSVVKIACRVEATRIRSCSNE